MCRCGGICKFRKVTDKDRLLGICIHGVKGANYSYKSGFALSPNCKLCEKLTEEGVKAG